MARIYSSPAAFAPKAPCFLLNTPGAQLLLLPTLRAAATGQRESKGQLGCNLQESRNATFLRVEGGPTQEAGDKSEGAGE